MDGHLFTRQHVVQAERDVATANPSNAHTVSKRMDMYHTL